MVDVTCHHLEQPNHRVSKLGKIIECPILVKVKQSFYQTIKEIDGPRHNIYLPQNCCNCPKFRKLLLCPTLRAHLSDYRNSVITECKHGRVLARILVLKFFKNLR